MKEPVTTEQLAEAVTKLVLQLLVSSLFAWRAYKRGWRGKFYWKTVAWFVFTFFTSWFIALVFYWAFVLWGRRRDLRREESK